MLKLERLDERAMPSVSVVYDGATHVCTITGTDHSEEVIPFYTPGGINIFTYDFETGTAANNFVPYPDVTKFVVNLGGDGHNQSWGVDDIYFNTTCVADVVHGGKGNDMLFGGDEGGGQLYGDEGNDILDAGNSSTFGRTYLLDGGQGDDTLICCFGPQQVVRDKDPNSKDVVLYFDQSQDVFI